jgi:hypothetical protein
VIDPTLGGALSELAPEFEERALNTASGHLDWKRRFDKVLVPTVYSKTKWARRRLHPKEILRALDIPADVQDAITAGIVEYFVQMPVPGKVRTHVLRVLLGEHLDKKRPAQDTVESETSKQPRTVVEEVEVQTVPEEMSVEEDQTGTKPEATTKEAERGS